MIKKPISAYTYIKDNYTAEQIALCYEQSAYGEGELTECRAMVDKVNKEIGEDNVFSGGSGFNDRVYVRTVWDILSQILAEKYIEEIINKKGVH